MTRPGGIFRVGDVVEFGLEGRTGIVVMARGSGRYDVESNQTGKVGMYWAHTLRLVRAVEDKRAR